MPSHNEIHACVQALIGHPGFQASARRKRLLAYLVEQTLAGRAERLKAYDIALAVLGRDERFDPQQDPIVRLEARRLRRDLEHYYLTAGAADPIRIDIPKGGYVPAFTRPEVPAAVPTTPPPTTGVGRRGRPAMLATAAATLLLAIAAVVAVVRQAGAPAPAASARGPSVLVMPLQGLGGEEATLLATGLTNQLVADLTALEDLQVYAGAVPPGAPEPELPPVTFRVEGSVQRDAARIRVGARLIDAATNEVLWNETRDLAASMASVLAVQDELGQRIAERLTLPNGAIAVAMERPQATRPSTLFAYDCVQQAWLYRRRSIGRERSEVMACLDEAVAREPDYADAWAMKAFLHMDAARLGLVPAELVAAEFTASRIAAERSMALSPRNIPSLQAMANVRYNDGAYAEAERLQREAIALRPHNPESLAQLGWRLWARGRLDEGVALLEDAIERSWRSPTWYHQTLAVGLYLRGDRERAYAQALLGRNFCCGLGEATLAISAASLGRAEEARAALERAVAQSSLLARDPRAFWRVFHVKEDLIQQLVLGLERASHGAVAVDAPAPVN